jgi:flagellar basal body-associated protein FliL
MSDSADEETQAFLISIVVLLALIIVGGVGASWYLNRKVNRVQTSLLARAVETTSGVFDSVRSFFGSESGQRLAKEGASRLANGKAGGK